MKQYDDTFTTISRKELRNNLGTERKQTWAELLKKKNTKNQLKKENVVSKWNSPQK